MMLDPLFNFQNDRIGLFHSIRILSDLSKILVLPSGLNLASAKIQ